MPRYESSIKLSRTCKQWPTLAVGAHQSIGPFSYEGKKYNIKHTYFQEGSSSIEYYSRIGQLRLGTQRWLQSVYPLCLAAPVYAQIHNDNLFNHIEAMKGIVIDVRWSNGGVRISVQAFYRKASENLKFMYPKLPSWPEYVHRHFGFLLEHYK